MSLAKPQGNMDKCPLPQTPANTNILLEHLREFAKINLANLMFWQLGKIYAKLKRKLSPRVCHLGLVK